MLRLWSHFRKKKILIEALAITIPLPLQEAKAIQTPQCAFSPTHNQPESGTSRNCFHCYENDIFQPTPLRHQYLLLTQKQLIHHLINQFTLVSSSFEHPFKFYFTGFFFFFRICHIPHFTSSEIWMHLTIDGMSWVIDSISSPFMAGKIMIHFIINDILHFMNYGHPQWLRW